MELLELIQPRSRLARPLVAKQGQDVSDLICRDGGVVVDQPTDLLVRFGPISLDLEEPGQHKPIFRGAGFASHDLLEAADCLLAFPLGRLHGEDPCLDAQAGDGDGAQRRLRFVFRALQAHEFQGALGPFLIHSGRQEHRQDASRPFRVIRRPALELQEFLQVGLGLVGATRANLEGDEVPQDARVVGRFLGPADTARARSPRLIVS